MNWLDILIIICVIAGLIKGLFDGFIKQVVSFLALLAAIFFAGHLAIPLRGFLLDVLPPEISSPPIVTGLSYLLGFILIMVIISLLGNIVSMAIKMTPAKPLNVLLGGIVGFGLWLLSLSILFNIFTSLDKDSRLISKQTKENSVLYSKVKDVVPAIYPFIKSYFNIKDSDILKSEKSPIFTV